MAFSEKSEQLVKDLIQAEYENACEQAKKEFNDNYIDRYHSLYEGYAILKEEVEEVFTETKELESGVEMLWDFIKSSLITKEEMIKVLPFINASIKCAIKELAQIGAVFMKIQNTLEKAEK